MTTIAPRAVRIAAFALLLCLASLMIACNTIKGVGEDVSAAGQSLADVADDAKE